MPLIDIQCASAAVLFFASALCQLVFDATIINTNFFRLQNLDILAIEEYYESQIEKASYQYAATVFNCIAWILVATIIVRLTWTLSQGGKTLIGTSIMLVIVTLVGAFTEVISSLMGIGFMKATSFVADTYNLDVWLDIDNELEPDIIDPEGSEDWDSYDPEDSYDSETEPVDDFDGGPMNTTMPSNTTGAGGLRFLEEEIGDGYDYPFDGLGWKTLNIIRVTIKGLLSWISSLEFVFFAAIFALMFFSVKRSDALSSAWSYFGLGLSALFSLEFIAELNTLYGAAYEWGLFAAILGGINRLVLLPIWLLWLGRLMYLVPENQALAKPSPIGTHHLELATVDFHVEDVSNNNFT